MADQRERLSAALADRYGLERELGQGGMATVYLAHDRKLGRAVALKVLRPELAAALGAERFLREIEIAAKLAHPHILALHDCGEADGLLYYTMPYVEGESLRDRLTREKQLPLEEALRIAREVADALSYAHALGLVHRDIKPENILFEAGHAVVADFGIARAVSAAGGAKLTETGLAVGTPAYMSPEQAAGLSDVDGRSDLYSLGCVLYEMLAGETPYTGPTPQAVFAKKLSEPLPRISVVREAVPPGVEGALNRALARTPADRWPTAADFAAALAHPELAVATPSGVTAAGAPAVTTWRRLPRWARWVAGAAAAVVAALAVLQFLRPRPLVVAAANLTPVTSEPGAEWQPAISPDGKQVAYVIGMRDARLFVRSAANVSGGAALRVGDSTPGGKYFPTWTPDGQSLRYVSCPATGCAWQETSSLGGAVRTIPHPEGRWFWMSWAPDGARFAYFRNDTLFTSAATDTAEHFVAVRTSGNSAVHSLAWSPDAKRIAYVAGNSQWSFGANVLTSAIWVVDAAGGIPRQVVSDEYLNVSPAWLDSRHLLFVSNRDGPRGAYIVEVGPDGPRGSPRAIPGIAEPHSLSYSPSARRLAFSHFTWRQNIWSYPLNPPSPVPIRSGRPVTTGNEVIEEHDVSPEGRWIAYSGNLRGSSDLYKLPLSGGAAVQLTATPTRDEFGPMWSPDGREIAFYATERGGGTEIYVMPSDGGTAVNVSRSPQPTENTHSASWQPDGLGLSFFSWRGKQGPTWLARRDSLRGAWHAPVVLSDSGCCLIASAWAPDSSGFVSPRGDPKDRGAPAFALVGPDLRVRRRAWPVAGPLRFDSRMVYSRDGRTVYGVSEHPDGRVGVWAIPVAAGGAPRLIVALGDPDLMSPSMISVGPDRLYLTVSQYESDIWVADLRW